MRSLDQYNEDTSHAFNQQQIHQQTEESPMSNEYMNELAAKVSSATPELNKAFAAARAEIHNPELDSVNPHFQSRFSSLTAVINAVAPALAKHGIAVTQDIEVQNGGIVCFTTLLHESGEERTSKGLYIPNPKGDAHGTIAASTYARRVQLSTICGIAGEADDDGNTASRPTVETVTPEEAADLDALIDEVGAKRVAFLKACGVKDLEQLPKSKLAGAIARLEAKRKVS